jgi:thymidylate synthase (FAD)
MKAKPQAVDAVEREISAARGRSGRTLRTTVPAMEKILFRRFPVLDHGFVRVVDYMGGDESVVQAARVSYGRGTKKTSDDRGLIRYLMRRWHTTPFEMCEIKLHVKLPIFVARQWVRHRMSSINELSARYSVLDREFYVPDESVIGVQDMTNRQGRGGILPRERARQIIGILREDAARCYDHYEGFMKGEGESAEAPLARELARINLPVGLYTQWYWKTDLHNLLNFLRLRMDVHAQFEIREYARVIGGMAAKWVPLSWEAFQDYRFGAVSLSRHELEVARALAAGKRPRKQDLSALSGRELRELAEKLGVRPERLR